MAFTTQAEAKRFLVSRVAEQAARDGVELSDAGFHHHRTTGFQKLSPPLVPVLA